MLSDLVNIQTNKWKLSGNNVFIPHLTLSIYSVQHCLVHVQAVFRLYILSHHTVDKQCLYMQFYISISIPVTFCSGINNFTNCPARARSARARRARALRALGVLLADGTPTGGRGEDFLSRQPDFFTETAVTSERKVEKSFPRWEINRHVEG